jgi:hypothetical protein
MPASSPATPSARRPNFGPDSTFARGFGALPQKTPVTDVGKVARDIAAEYLARTVSDAEILDHIEHCTHLMELAYERGERAQAYAWMWRRSEAMEALSPAWKAQREAAIQAAIDGGVHYFAAAGDRDRAALARRAA